MADILTGFEWYRQNGGYEIVRFGDFNPPWKQSNKYDDVPWIVPKRNEGVLAHRPFGRRGNVCDAFAEIKTSEQLLSFINGHGPLTLACHPRQGLSDLSGVDAVG